jgi:hypothetical protein
MHRIYSLWTTGQEQARLDAEFEVKMRKLEQDGEDLNRMQALITAKKEARQCYRNSSARVCCHLTTINLPDFSPGFAAVDSRFLRMPASKLKVNQEKDSHGAGHTADASAAPEEP